MRWILGGQRERERCTLRNKRDHIRHLNNASLETKKDKRERMVQNKYLKRKSLRFFKINETYS